MNQKLIEKVDRMLSHEVGTIYKDPGGKITIALVYPNTYHVGMSNLGFQGLYGLLNKRKDTVCERAFLPDIDDLHEYTRTRTELFSMESKRPLNRFHIVAFSVSFENDYPNIVTILRLAGIPPMSAGRDGRNPLVIMGGACAFFNPEPLADLIDVCFVGEAEEMMSEFLDRYHRASDRDDLLENSLDILGVYVPRFYRISYDATGRITGRTVKGDAPPTVKRRCVRDLSTSPMSTSIMTPHTEFADRYLIEAMRGCPWSCRFCVARSIYSPPRIKHLDCIRREIQEASTHVKRIGLISPSISDYPHIREVLGMPGVDFSTTSLRVGEKSVGLTALMKGTRSVSIAPEAGTERLRKVINKNIREQDILSTAAAIWNQGIETLRLYFMIGLPTETPEDVEGLIRLVKDIRAITGKGSISVSISTFVPKPFTPFQWHPMESITTVKERLRTIKGGLKQEKNVKVFHDVPKYAYLQGLFSRGDRRLSTLLTLMSPNTDWHAAASAAGIDLAFYVHRRRTFDEVLPWDFIDMGIEKEKLWTEYQEALSHGANDGSRSVRSGETDMLRNVNARSGPNRAG